MFLQVIPGLKGEKAAQMGDVILVSDVDEIVRPAALQILRNCDFPLRLTLRSQFYYYGFQFLHQELGTSSSYDVPRHVRHDSASEPSQW
jgi:beta-1,4-mannosyl-glycoprotein beta-1,4-N-acetylglucosaminyltransferase